LTSRPNCWARRMGWAAVPLVPARTPVVSLGANAQGDPSRSGAESLGIACAYGSVGRRSSLAQVHPPQVFRVSRGILFIEQGRDGRLEASIIGIPRNIVKTVVSQLALRSRQAFSPLRQMVLGVIHITVQFYQSRVCTENASGVRWDSITIRSPQKTPHPRARAVYPRAKRGPAAGPMRGPLDSTATVALGPGAAAVIKTPLRPALMP
jgi:hypothetical protein